MTPHTAVGWILFTTMCLSGPITGYLACNLISTVREGDVVGGRSTLTFGIFCGLMLASTSVLVSVQGL